MKYYVHVGERDHEVVIDGSQVTIDGQPVEASLTAAPSGSGYEWFGTLDGRMHQLATMRGENGSRLLDVEGHLVTVLAIDERRRAIQQLSGSALVAGGPKPLVAPMPGMIIRVNVAAGDRVRAGQGLVVMEAMKMENELRAAADATVKSVRVSAGAAVEKGALLIEMA